MSTPEQPDSPPLTRKQMRDIRNTGATPIIDTGALAVMTSTEPEVPVAAGPFVPPPVEESLPAVAPPAPLARAAEPLILPAPPGPDRGVDLGVSPLTRRQARQQERIRTASVPVITPEVSAAYAAQVAAGAAGTAAPSMWAPPAIVPEPEASEPEAPDSAPEPAEDPFAALGVVSEPIAFVPEPVAVESADVEPAPVELAAVVVDAEPEPEPEPESAPDVWALPANDSSDEPEQEAPRTVAPGFGAALLAGGAVAGSSDAAPSFDELVTRSSSGSVATPNALILSQSPNGGPIVAPVAATGEVLITGSFNLPEGLGSTGHAPGTADGKEVDAVLVDGELPAHSSPTPIAASAAVSTVKTPGEIIKPPAPEKGGKLMLTLAITAGALALALVGVLILAFATGAL